MFKNAAVLLIALFTFGCAHQAYSADTSRDTDKAEIAAIFESLGSAWAAGDGAAWGASFADDADFTVWFGFRLSGAPAIGEGHQMIFDGVYAGTIFDLEIASLRFLGDDLALAHLNGWVYPTGQARPEGEPQAHPLAVVTRNDGVWKIAAFQNTPNFGPSCFGTNLADVLAKGSCAASR